MSQDAAAHKPIAWWWITVVILGALLLAAGAAIALVSPAMLASPHDQINNAVHIYACYLASRNFALAFMLLAFLILRARAALGTLMVLVACIQFLDACFDCADGRWSIVPGILVFGAVFLIGAARLTGLLFWRRDAWIHFR